MTNTTVYVNNKNDYSNLATPYDLQVSHGIYSPSHTSDVSLIYGPATFLTPWPYLLVNMSVSLLVGVWGVYSTLSFARQARKKRQRIIEALEAVNSTHQDAPPNDRRRKHATSSAESLASISDIRVDADELKPVEYSLFSKSCDVVSCVWSTIRSFSTFILSIHAVRNSASRFRSPLSISLLMLSTVPFVVDIDRPLLLRTVMLTDEILAFLSMQMMLFSGLRSSSDFYGRWLLNGGECPFAVKSCPSDFRRVGCGLQNLTHAQYDGQGDQNVFNVYDYNHLGGSNFVRTGDFAIGIAIDASGYLIIAAIPMIWYWFKMVNQSIKHFVSTLNIWRKGGVLPTRTQSVQDIPLSRSEATTALENRRISLDKFEHNKLKSFLTAFSIVGTIVTISAIYISLHYVQQTQPKSVWVIDSHGPLAGYNTITNGSNSTLENSGTTTAGSWSDCFEIKAAHDHLGFFKFWWSIAKDKPLEYLPVL